MDIEVKQILKNSHSHMQLQLWFTGTTAVFCLSWLALSSQSLLVNSTSLVLLPLFYFRCFALMHDAVHHCVVKNKFLNNTIGILTGIFCFLPFHQWRKIHLQHHRWAGNTDKDPSMRIIKDFPSYNKSYVKRLNWLWQSWLPYLAFLQHIVFWRAGIVEAKQELKSGDYAKPLLSYSIPLMIYSSLLFNINSYQAIFLMGSIFIYLVIVEVINFPHHLQLPQYHGNQRISPLQQYRVSRSCHYHYLISYFLLNNFNYHIEHHLYPSAPWYTLHKLRPIVKARLQNQYNESLSNSWIIKNRKKTMEELLLHKGKDLPKAG